MRRTSGDRGAIRHTADEIRELMPLSPPTQEADRVGDYCLLAFGIGRARLGLRLGCGAAALCSRRAAPLRASTFCAAAWRLGSCRWAAPFHASCPRSLCVAGCELLLVELLRHSVRPREPAWMCESVTGGGAAERSISACASARGMNRSMCCEPTRLLRKAISSSDSPNFASPISMRCSSCSLSCCTFWRASSMIQRDGRSCFTQGCTLQ